LGILVPGQTQGCLGIPMNMSQLEKARTLAMVTMHSHALLNGTAASVKRLSG